jgi:aldose 1-epimerase
VQTITLQNSYFRLEIAPDIGASLLQCDLKLHDHWVPLLRPTPPDFLGSWDTGCFLLAPFSNRVPNGQFTFQGTAHQLRLNAGWEGNAIHGDVDGRKWEVLRATDQQAQLRFDARTVPDFNFPFPISIAVMYALEGDTFSATLGLTNVADTPIPAGFGFHPQFVRALVAGEDVEIRFDVHSVYNDLIPTSAPAPLAPAQDFSTRRAVGETTLDHCFTEWDGHAELYWPTSKVRAMLVSDPLLRHLIVHTPEGKPWVSLEPVSHATNGFNLLAAGYTDSGIQILPPGATMQGGFRVNVQFE